MLVMVGGIVDACIPGNDSADALIVLGRPKTHSDAAGRCADLNEAMSAASAETYRKLLPRLLLNRLNRNQSFWIAGRTGTSCPTVNQYGIFNSTSCEENLPAICTQSAPITNADSSDVSTNWHIQLPTESGMNITGYRDRHSFRFMGVRFASQPARWTQSTPYKMDESTDALTPGNRCKQPGADSSEDCLFLNIFSPFLPSSRSELAPAQLKPVMVFIHGGSFIGGDASDSFSDGSNMASRGDTVVVIINYRLGVFGFLALEDGETNGNYGLGDQITALRWLQKNIATYGGDPDRITLFGQSAGAASVRALLASPLSRDMIAGAIMQSSPAGRGMGYPYSYYQNISEVMQYIDTILKELGCADATSRLACLKRLSADELAETGSKNLRIYGVNQAFLVKDGQILDSNELDIISGSELDSSSSPIPILLGIMRDDGALFLPAPDETNMTASFQAAPLGLSQPLADSLTAYTNTTSLAEILPSAQSNISTSDLADDIYNITNRISTSGTFSCASYATAFAASSSSHFNRTYLYEMHRAYATYDDTPSCNAPITSKYPNGDPYEGYICHSGDNNYVFGNLAFLGLPERDQYDTPFSRQLLDSWTAFARTGDPNPDPAWMRAMGYSLDYGLGSDGPWLPAAPGTANVRRLGPIGSAMIGPSNSKQSQLCSIMNVPQTLYT